MCLSIVDTSENAGPHTSHKKAFPPVHACKCLCKLACTENAGPHTSQGNVFFLVCVCIWFFKLEMLANVRHKTQENSFPSSVCLYVSFKMHFLKTLSYTLHMKMFSLLNLFPYVFSYTKSLKMLTWCLCKTILHLLCVFLV